MNRQIVWQRSSASAVSASAIEWRCILPRSIELIVAKLAALKCRAAYVPLDGGGAAARQAFIVEDCRAKVVITERGVEPGANDARAARGDEDAAYVIYTSGSTGEPKGVEVAHRAVQRLVRNNAYAELGPTDRMAWVGNPAFDISTLEVWGPLLNGGTIVVVSAEDVSSREGCVMSSGGTRSTYCTLRRVCCHS